ncbi:MAG: zinc-ribbon domain-containing protein [Desulfobacterales bacterium]|nr:zinc-ribbon domain-containing protein [Desulfobacterales bacterium]
MIIASCEECGKRYEIDTAQIEGRETSFKCKSCNHLITVVKPEGNPTDLAPAPEPKEKKKKVPEEVGRKLKGLGIRGKMFLVLFLIPLAMLVFAVPFSIRYITKAIDGIIQETAQAEAEVAKNQANQFASTIAKQVETYLLAHPELKSEGLAQDPGLREIVTQRQLMSGEASLYLRLDPEKPGTLLIAKNPSLEGQTLESIMIKGQLGKDKYDEFGKITRTGPAPEEYREASDFFLSQDEEGTLRERMAAFAPVSGTPYGIMYSALTADFMSPAIIVEDRVRNLLSDTRTIVIGIFGGTLLLIGIIMLLYLQRLTKRIKSLTDITNRISVGELEARVEIQAGDEIGALAEAISRMQDSIRLAIERLRRRA